MRTIKFRAWDKDKNEWVWPGQFLLGHLVSWTNNNEFEVLGRGRFEVTQCTGLEDRNGTEIYEGDILKVPVDINQEVHGNYSLHEVQIKKGVIITSYLKSQKGQILPKGYTAGFLLDSYEFDNKSFLFNDDPLMDTKVVVIGNKFENPDLLEDEE